MMVENNGPVVVETRGLVKRYRVYPTPLSRLKEVLSLNRRSYHREFTALEGIDLSIAKGRTVGALGRNGAGKSTLLKILAGIISPTEGDLRVEGRVSSIIELGAGFHPEFTGRENARLNAAVLGFNNEQIDAIYDQVVQFSELGNYIDLPVKTYSSGMFTRLAFSIAIHVQPDILLIDEALAVGDAIFSQRCIQEIRRMQEQGVTIFFVSHDTNAVRSLCDEVLLLERGRIIAQGPPRDVVQQYEVMVAERLAQLSVGKVVEFHDTGAPETGDRMGERRFGDFSARIVSVALENEQGDSRERFLSGEKMRARLRVQFAEEIDNPVFGIMIRNRFGVEAFGANTNLMKLETGNFTPNSEVEVVFEVELNLGHGSYQLSFAVHTPENHVYDYRVDCAVIEVLGAEESIGIAPLPASCAIQR
jgi:ABC-type polysaccharide/polyol phosphate transport system ATPase subunit